jgi:hypothetical protein
MVTSLVAEAPSASTNANIDPFQKQATEALSSLPAPLRRAIDTIPVQVKQGPPQQGQRGSSIASVGINEPNTIEVNDPKTFKKSPAEVLGHEAVHLWQNNLPPSIQAKMPADAPGAKAYDISDVDKLRKSGKTLSDLPSEKAATIVQTYIARPDLRKKLQPWIDDMNTTPQSITMPTGPNDKGLNMKPRPPVPPAFAYK